MQGKASYLELILLYPVHVHVQTEERSYSCWILRNYGSQVTWRQNPFYLSINIMSLLILKFVNLIKYSLNANNRAFLLQCISELETRKLRGSWKFSLQLFTTAFLSTQFGLNASTTTFQNRLHSSSLCRLRLKNVAFAIEVLAHSCMAFI